MDSKSKSSTHQNNEKTNHFTSCLRNHLWISDLRTGCPGEKRSPKNGSEVPEKENIHQKNGEESGQKAFGKEENC